jgi:hypothetical protein
MAGYLEGRATALDMFHFYDNLKFNNPYKTQFIEMKNFFIKVVSNLQRRIKNIKSIKKGQSIVWSRLLLGYTQLEGLLQAYTYEMKRLNKYNEESKMDLADLLIMQADGEIPELIRYFRQTKVKTKIGENDYFKVAFGIDTKDPKEFWSRLMMQSKCSAFIKLTKDKEGKWDDLLVGHTTWAYYYEMLRSFKQ